MVSLCEVVRTKKTVCARLATAASLYYLILLYPSLSFFSVFALFLRFEVNWMEVRLYLRSRFLFKIYAHARISNIHLSLNRVKMRLVRATKCIRCSCSYRVDSCKKRAKLPVLFDRVASLFCPLKTKLLFPTNSPCSVFLGFCRLSQNKLKQPADIEQSIPSSKQLLKTALTFTEASIFLALLRSHNPTKSNFPHVFFPCNHKYTKVT